MPILALIPLIFEAIKIAMALVAWLQEHPEVEAGAKEYLGSAYKALEASQTHVLSAANTLPQANNIESP